MTRLWIADRGLWMLTALVIAGCHPQPVPTTQPKVVGPTYRELAAAQNARVEQLQALYGSGVIEIRWADDQKKRHFEQGEMELWFNLPRKTALRVEKVGEVLLWLGSDDDRYWMFDRLNKEKVLRVSSHDKALTDDRGRAFAVKPMALLDLMGLTPLPASAADPALNDSMVKFDPQRNAWSVRFDGRGGAVRVFFDRATLLPQRVESLDSQDQVILFSDLKRYESVQLQGKSPAAFPKMAELIDISDVQADPSIVGQVKIAIDHYNDGYDQPFDRVFDLKRLAHSFQPDRVEGQLPQ